MARQSETVCAIYDTLHSAGIRKIGEAFTGKGHVRISWRAPDGTPRHYITTTNRSDTHAARNARAAIRRQLRSDGNTCG